MADVATTAVVYAAGTNPKAPINNLTALNFVGLSGDEGGVQQIASGEYTLSFDDTLTAQITCEVNGYQNNTQSWGNNPVPALLTFAMQKSGGVVGPSLSVQLDIASPPSPRKFWLVPPLSSLFGSNPRPCRSRVLLLIGGTEAIRPSSALLSYKPFLGQAAPR